MKILKNKTRLFIAFLIIFLAIVVINILTGVYPLLDFMQYLAAKNFFWIVPLFFIGLFAYWQHTINVKKRVNEERRQIFIATMRTIQDILQNSASSMQLLILDMKDAGVHEEIIQKAEKNIDEMKSVISTLSAVDPNSIHLKELNDNLSIIKMSE